MLIRPRPHSLLQRTLYQLDYTLETHSAPSIRAISERLRGFPVSHCLCFGITATLYLPRDKGHGYPSSFSKSDEIHTAWNGVLFFWETFWKISAQAKINYTFQCIYLLLKMFALIRCCFWRLACNECLKNPSCSISKTFITAVIVLITASTIPETFFSLAFMW